MVHYSDHEQLLQYPEDEYLTGTKEYDISQNHGPLDHWITTPSLGSLDTYTHNGPFCIHGRTNHRPAMVHHQSPLSRAMEQDDRLPYAYSDRREEWANGDFPTADIDPALISIPDTAYNQAASINVHDQQCACAEASIAMWSANLDTQTGSQFPISGSTDSDYGIAAPGQGEQAGAHARMYSGTSVSTVVSTETPPGLYDSRPDRIFLSQVLERQQGYEDILGTYTDQLVDTLCAPSGEGQLHPSFDTPSVMDWERNRGNDRVTQMMESHLPRWFVSEGTPRLEDPSASESPSR